MDIENRKKVYSISKLILLLVIIIALPIYLYLYKSEAIMAIKSVDDVAKFLVNTPFKGLLFYALVSIVQVVVSIIPAQAVQFAAGYIYGPIWGSIVAISGIALGETITFFLARYLGKDALNDILGEKFIKINDKVSSKRGFILVGLIYLIPGMPKDLLCYVCGVSNYSYKTFILLSITMRTPAIIGSVLMGVFTFNSSYTITFIILGISILLAILGYLFKDKISNKIDHLYIKLIK